QYSSGGIPRRVALGRRSFETTHQRLKQPADFSTQTFGRRPALKESRGCDLQYASFAADSPAWTAHRHIDKHGFWVVETICEPTLLSHELGLPALGLPSDLQPFPLSQKRRLGAPAVGIR